MLKPAQAVIVCFKLLVQAVFVPALDVMGKTPFFHYGKIMFNAPDLGRAGCCKQIAGLLIVAVNIVGFYKIMEIIHGLFHV